MSSSRAKELKRIPAGVPCCGLRPVSTRKQGVHTGDDSKELSLYWLEAGGHRLKQKCSSK